jgi:enterochelin esterase-like enzyme
VSRVTRRRLLLGGDAVLGAGTVGPASVLHPRQLWQRLSGACGSEPARPPRSETTLVRGAFRSQTVPGDVGYLLALPPGARDEPPPVCICLPGRGTSAADTITGPHLHDYVAQAITQRGVRPYALASVHGGESYWHRRSSGEDHMAMLLDEFIPLIERRGLGAAGTGRAVMGWSMGGYGALRATAGREGMFRATVAESDAVWTSYENAVPDAFDGAGDWATHDIFGRPPAPEKTPLKVDVGRDDPFAGAVSELRSRLRPTPAGEVAQGCHDVRFWRRMAASGAAFVRMALA